MSSKKIFAGGTGFWTGMKTLYRKLCRSGKIPVLMLACSGLLVLPSGCKDTNASHDAAQLESCKLALDNSEWDDAISACEDASGDEGLHLKAQAYMGKSGISIVLLMLALSGGDEAIATMFEAIPDTAAKAGYLKSAMDVMMSSRIETKTPTMYLETLLLSSLLIFYEMKNLVDLDFDNDGNPVYCNVLDAAAADACSFAPTPNANPGIEFPGLGSDFYDGICGESSSDTYVNVNVGSFFYDITVDSCTIQETSTLYYNKIAYENYTGSITGLDDLSFYPQMDNGQNFTITGTPNISFCGPGRDPTPDVSDDTLSDCEILHYFTIM